MKVEPSAEVRRFAKQIRGFYIALIDEGFTPWEALQVIATSLEAQQGRHNDSDS